MQKVINPKTEYYDNNVINPKTHKPYSQDELQTAYEKGKELPVILDYSKNTGYIYGVHIVSKIWVEENGKNKEVYI